MIPNNEPANAVPELVERLFVIGHQIANAKDTESAIQIALAAVIGSSVKISALSAAPIHSVVIASINNESLPTLTAWDAPSTHELIRPETFTFIPSDLLKQTESGETLLLDDLGENPSFDAPFWLERNLHSCLITPLMVGGHNVGLMLIASDHPDAFSAADVRLFQILADQLALRFGNQSENVAVVATDNHLSGLNAAGRSAGDCLIGYDLSRKIATLNLAAESLYRYSGGDLIGKNGDVLVPRHRRKEYDTWWTAVIADGRAVRGETERMDKLGRVFPAYVSLWPLKDEVGTVIAAAEVVIDHSKQMLLMSAMQKERDLLEAILETSNDAIIMIDTVRTIITANLQFETFFRVPRYQFINRGIDDLVDKLRESNPAPIGLMNLLLTYSNDTFQTGAGDFENETVEKRVLVWYSAPVHGNDGTLFGRLFVFRDATREREVDRMKTEFVSLVSHELRTPLSSVKGFTDFILDGDAGPIDDGVREYLEIVKFNSERLMSLINDILDITRIEAGRIELRQELQPVQKLIESSRMSVLPMVEERHQRLGFDVEAGLPNVWVDHDRMTQVITNLLSNASKYMPKEGTITVEARLMTKDRPRIAGTPDETKLPAVLIGIHDTGIGIAEKDQPFLFNRFYRTEQATEQQIAGTGLGLVIVKSLVELHGGQVWLQSELNRGSSFYFTIPLLEGIT